MRETLPVALRLMLDPSPRPAGRDALDAGLFYPKAERYFRLKKAALRPEAPDFPDLIDREFRPASILAVHVDHVVLRRPKEQMVWVHAGPKITPVKQVHPGRDRPAFNFPHDAGRGLNHRRVIADAAVALSVDRALPRPALVYAATGKVLSNAL